MKKYYLLLLLIPFLIAASSKNAEIGEIIYYSASEYANLTSGCYLTYDKATRKLKCLDTEIYYEFNASAIELYKFPAPMRICQDALVPCYISFDDGPPNAEYGLITFTLPDRLKQYYITGVQFNGTGGDAEVADNTVIFNYYIKVIEDLGEIASPTDGHQYTAGILTNGKSIVSELSEVDTIPVLGDNKVIIAFTRNYAEDNYEDIFKLYSIQVKFKLDYKEVTR